jgi:hypothetical protein
MIRNIGYFLLAFVMLDGCVLDPDSSPGDSIADGAPSGMVETTSQPLVGIQERASDNRSFGGNIFSEDFHYVIGGLCSPGHTRVDLSGDPTTQWTSQSGGYCAFEGWVTPSNTRDCGAIIHAHTGGGWFGGSCLSVVHEAWDVPSEFQFDAVATNSATVNTTDFEIVLGTGETVAIGTYDMPGAEYNGDTFLILHYPLRFPFWGAAAAANDDVMPGILGSKIVYTVPMSGTYKISAGCYANTACRGTVVWHYTGTP